jgi:uncharacterized damage-inducible protein DinB
MTSVLLELYRHKTWATLRLIEFCEKLPPENLEETTPGTYGSIRATLHHLVTAEDNYQTAVTGEPIGEPLPPDATLETLARRIRALAPRWEALANDPAAPEREVSNRAGTRIARGVAVLAQAIHHADDHRTQVASILGGRGVEPPDLDVWAYGEEAGYVRTRRPSTLPG